MKSNFLCYILVFKYQCNINNLFKQSQHPLLCSFLYLVFSVIKGGDKLYLFIYFLYICFLASCNRVGFGWTPLLRVFSQRVLFVQTVHCS